MKIALVTAIAAFSLDDDLAPLQQALEKAGVTEMLHLDRPSAARKAYGLRRTVISKIRNLFRRS